MVQSNAKPSKLREVLFYLCDKTAGHVDSGLVYVCRLLKFIDESWCCRYGGHLVRSTQSLRYFGPTGRELDQTIKAMVADGTVRVEHRQYFGYQQTKLVPQRPSADTGLTPQELDVVNEVLERYSGLNATQMSGPRPGPWQVRYRDSGEPESLGAAIRRDARAARRKEKGRPALPHDARYVQGPDKADLRPAGEYGVVEPDDYDPDAVS